MTPPTLRDPAGKIPIITDPAKFCDLCKEWLLVATPDQPARPGLNLWGKTLCSTCTSRLSDRLTIHIAKATVAMLKR